MVEQVEEHDSPLKLAEHYFYFVTISSHLSGCLASWKAKLLTHYAEKGYKKAVKDFQLPNFSVLNPGNSSKRRVEVKIRLRSGDGIEERRKVKIQLPEHVYRKTDTEFREKNTCTAVQHRAGPSGLDDEASGFNSKLKRGWHLQMGNAPDRTINASHPLLFGDYLLAKLSTVGCSAPAGCRGWSIHMLLWHHRSAPQFNGVASKSGEGTFSRLMTSSQSLISFHCHSETIQNTKDV